MTAITIYASVRPRVTARLASSGDASSHDMTALARRSGVSWLTNKRLVKGIGELKGPGFVPDILDRWARQLEQQGLPQAQAQVLALKGAGTSSKDIHGPCTIEMRDLYTLMPLLDCEPLEVWRLWEVKRCISCLNRYSVRHEGAPRRTWEIVVPEEEDARAVAAVDMYLAHAVLPVGSQLRFTWLGTLGLALVRDVASDTWSG